MHHSCVQRFPGRGECNPALRFFLRFFLCVFYWLSVQVDLRLPACVMLSDPRKRLDVPQLNICTHMLRSAYANSLMSCCIMSPVNLRNLVAAEWLMMMICCFDDHQIIE